MNSNPKNQDRSARYLLGEMAEAEQARFEELFFNDVELSELLSDVENDLIDQYVRGELTADERERFEAHFLVSERRREKVELARALLQAKDVRAASPVPDHRTALPWWKAPLAYLRVPWPALSYSVAAGAFVLLAGGLWLFVEVRQLRSNIARLEEELNTQSEKNDQLRDQANEQQRLSSELAAQRDQLERQLAELTRESGAPASAPDLASSFMTFTLLPGSRGEAGPKDLVIPPGMPTVRLQLNLSPGDVYPNYQVRLQTATGTPIRVWSRLKSRPAKGAQAVFVDVPVRLLNSGQFEVTLSGIASGRLEPVGYYYFSR